jgi:hypothetical protein
MKKLFLILIFQQIFFSIIFSTEEKKWSISVDDLRVRKNPSINSEVINSLKKFDDVEELERDKNNVKINNITSQWVKIRFYQNSEMPFEGWVFGGYLDKYENSNAYIFFNAQKIENLNPELSINEYKKLINRNNQWKKNAEERINIVNCKKQSDYYFSSSNEAIDKIVNAIKNKNKDFLSKYAGCELEMTIGPMIEKTSGNDSMKKININDFDLNNIVYDTDRVMIESIKYPNTYHGFKIEKIGLRWKWTGYNSGVIVTTANKNNIKIIFENNIQYNKSIESILTSFYEKQLCYLKNGDINNLKKFFSAKYLKEFEAGITEQGFDKRSNELKNYFKDIKSITIEIWQYNNNFIRIATLFYGKNDNEKLRLSEVIQKIDNKYYITESCVGFNCHD